MRAAVDDVTGLVRGALVVGMVSGCTVTPLFDALAAFRREHPGIELTLGEDPSDRLVDQVHAGAVDVALIGTPEPPPSGLEALVVVSEPLVAAVPEDHPLAARERIGLAELAEHTLVTMPRGTGIRAVLDQACAARGLAVEIALQASAPEAVADLAGRGLAVAVLSASMVAGRAGLRALAIDDLDASAALALVWRPGEPPALRALLADLRAAFEATAAAARAAAAAPRR